MMQKHMLLIERYKGYSIYYHRQECRFYVRGIAQVYTRVASARRGIDRHKKGRK